MDKERMKEAAGHAAADALVRSGMKLGLGTGSTAIHAVRRVGRMLQEGTLRDILAVATSSQTEMECQKLGIPLRSLNDPEIGGTLDLTIDGADEADRVLFLTKGGGGALLIEKVVAYASAAFAVVTDESKLVEHLGLSFPIPLEVLPLARVTVMRRLSALGAEPEVRMAVKKMGAVITDNGNIIVDVRFPGPFDPVAMERDLSLIPGVLGNGLFTRCRPELFVAKSDGTIDRRSAPAR